MWGRKSSTSGKTEEVEPTGLKAAVRQARIEFVDKCAVVGDVVAELLRTRIELGREYGHVRCPAIRSEGAIVPDL